MIIRASLQQLVKQRQCKFTVLIMLDGAKTLYSHPADMTEQNWDAVMRTNNVLSGQSIITGKFGPTKRDITTIERGVYTGKYYHSNHLPGHIKNYEQALLTILLAFKLKSRDFEPYQISYTTLETIGGKVSRPS